MSKKTSTTIMPDEIIMNKIYFIRKQKVMLDKDLAELYQVETKVLKQAVKRNIDIFPEHFMFELTEKEFSNLRSQFVTSSWGGQRYLPYVFSEHGILQLANVLRSKRAKQMSIRIIEVFVKMREMLADNTELRLEVEQIKQKLGNHTKNIELVFQYLDELLEKKEKRTKPRIQIGYKLPKKT
ncbi:MAG: ORF6N domain-containing protein [Bacteroidia bacterium]|nr:ORF6N domain-containing protein [Bacteroidia bacterium]